MRGASASVAGEREYRAHSYVIRAPPGYTAERGLELARDAVLGRARAARSGTRARTSHHARQVPIVALIAPAAALPNVRAVLVR